MPDEEKLPNSEPVIDSADSGDTDENLSENATKRKSDELELAARMRPRKAIKTEEKRIPNIAMELAKNRTTVKSHSPSPLNSSSIPLASLLSNEPQSAPTEDGSKVPHINNELQKTTLFNNSRLKVSSLLSDNSDGSQNMIAPKIILPTQNTEIHSTESDAPGTLVARINSPVTTLPKLCISGISRSQSTLNPASSTEVNQSAEVAKKTMSASTIGSKPVPKKQNGRKVSESRNSKKDSAPSEVKKDSKKTTKLSEPKKTPRGKDTKKDAKINEAKVPIKKELKAVEVSKDGKVSDGKKESKELETKKDIKVSEVKKDAKPNESKSKGNEAKKEAKGTKKGASASKKKDSTPQPPKKAAESKSPHLTPMKLMPAPVLKSPSLLDALEKPKASELPEDPIIVMDVPLYSTDSSDYLDENGQVIINFYKMVQDKFGNTSRTKRNLITGLNAQDDDDDDAVEVEDDDGEDDEDPDEDEDDEKQSASTASTASPKKKSHPMKGKSLIGKYDTEDPFIDDSELLWEEQRVATKDGFFVYYGPLIEKGQYASFERVNGTMKRGGIKYSR